MRVLSSSSELAEPAKPTPWIKRYFSCPRSKKLWKRIDVKKVKNVKSVTQFKSIIPFSIP